MQWRLPTSNPCVSLSTRNLFSEFLSFDSGHLDLFDKVVLNAITRFGLANLVQLAYLICVKISPQL